MSDFKFACPSCHQHIKIATELESRRIYCPSCQIQLIVPAPPKAAGEIPPATVAQPAAQLSPAAVPITKQIKTIPEPSLQDSPVNSNWSDTPSAPVLVAPLSELRVAVLTPALKLVIVRAVQSRLADKTRWLPGKKDAGDYDYAARLEGGQLIKVSPLDVAATQLSLFGAVMLEFHRHNVLRVTTGRRRFLDVELPAAIQQVLGKEPGVTPSESERAALTHTQCLAVLDVLEERIEREAVLASKRQQEKKVDLVRVADLVQKLENQTPMRIEEVACALYYELEELKQRLEELESNAIAKE